MYKRVLLKLSGEALKGEDASSIVSASCIEGMAQTIKDLHDRGIQICIVIGAGNIWRGKLAQSIGIEPVPADFMGMLGTVINAVCMSSVLKRLGVPSVVYSAVPEIPGVTVAYDQDKANQDLNEGKVCFLAGGTGKPFFTTDTAATMRAIELNCEAIFMGKNGVQGVYTSDPLKDPDAKFLPLITYKEILELNLQIMDISAVKLIQDKDIEIRVFSMAEPQNFIKVAEGEHIGTICRKGE
jgi:uridylate kinase